MEVRDYNGKSSYGDGNCWSSDAGVELAQTSGIRSENRGIRFAIDRTSYAACRSFHHLETQNAYVSYPTKACDKIKP